MNRREFLTAGAAAAAVGAAPRLLRAASGPARPLDWEEVRAAFPRTNEQVYLNAAGRTPLNTYTNKGIRRYLEYDMYGPGEGRGSYVASALAGVRSSFAQLLNAKSSEIGFVQCTKAGETLVANGLDIQASGGNVVTNDLHFSGSLHNYIGWRRAGMDVRIVKHHDWRIDLNDMERAVDSRTTLIAISLVSNINGWVEDAKALSDLAHAHGAYLYADIIQAAGAIPVDVQALGIDFAACSCYKWLQGVHGLAFLYVRDGLQGAALRDLLHPGHVRFNYPPWVAQPTPGENPIVYREPEDARRYEPGHANYAGYVGQFEALTFLARIGIERIAEHSRALRRRVRAELVPRGFTCITPEEAETPIITFLVNDSHDVEQRLVRHNVRATVAGDRLRIAPSIYNNEKDIDRLIESLV
jgi:selenocysteine lyase/cysteine desulfurase